MTNCVSIDTVENFKENKMLDAFMYDAYTINTTTRYYSYTFKRVNKQIRLLKGTKKINFWDFEKDTIDFYEKLSTAERQMAKKFSKLPLLAEHRFQMDMENKKHPKPEVDKDAHIKLEIKQALESIPEYELTKEKMTKLIEQFSDKYVCYRYDYGNPDYFNDNFLRYVEQSRIDVSFLISRIQCEKAAKEIKQLLRNPDSSELTKSN